MFTIEDLKTRKCALYNDGNLNELEEVLKAAFNSIPFVLFPHEDYKNMYFYKGPFFNSFNSSEYEPNLPVQKLSVFLKELHPEKYNDNEIDTNKEVFKPNHLDKVLVSDNGEQWYVRRYITTVGDKYMCTYYVEDNDKSCMDIRCEVKLYKFIKPYAKVVVSKDEIAKWKGCSVEDIKIV